MSTYPFFKSSRCFFLFLFSPLFFPSLPLALPWHFVASGGHISFFCAPTTRMPTGKGRARSGQALKKGTQGKSAHYITRTRVRYGNDQPRSKRRSRRRFANAQMISRARSLILFRSLFVLVSCAAGGAQVADFAPRLPPFVHSQGHFPSRPAQKDCG